MCEPTKPLIIHRIFKFERSILFNAFTTPEILEKWYSPSIEIPVNIKEYDFQVGGNYLISYTLPDGNKAVLKGEFIKINSPDELRMTWMWEHDEPAGISSLVTIKFIELGTTTELVITHEQLSTKNEIDRHNQGWLETLERLDNWLRQV